jgi:hypothetical protein
MKEEQQNYKRFIYPALQVQYDSESLSSPICENIMKSILLYLYKSNTHVNINFCWESLCICEIYNFKNDKRTTIWFGCTCACEEINPLCRMDNGIYCVSFELALKLSDRKTTKIYKRFIYPVLQVQYDSESLSVTCDMLVVFSGSSSFLHQ